MHEDREPGEPIRPVYGVGARLHIDGNLTIYDLRVQYGSVGAVWHRAKTPYTEGYWRAMRDDSDAVVVADSLVNLLATLNADDRPLGF